MPGIGTYPVLTSLLSQLSASDASRFLAVTFNILSLQIRANYLDPIRDLLNPAWWREKISNRFEIYLVGVEVGLLWKRIHQPLQYWKEHGTKTLRVLVVAVCPEAEKRIRCNPGIDYLVDKNWEIKWHTKADIRRNMNIHWCPDHPCRNSSCARCPFLSPLLPLPHVFGATDCQTPGTNWYDWYPLPSPNKIELMWKYPHSGSRPRIISANSPYGMAEIGGVNEGFVPSVQYICLSSKQLATSTLYEVVRMPKVPQKDSRFDGVAVMIEKNWEAQSSRTRC